ncbi:MAG: OmpA family protein [Flavobacteriaceae bacterium]|nr:OmpA family protein [Flavobacteriaceae bacterium]
MKKVILSFAVLAMVTSCKKEEKKVEKTEEIIEQPITQETPNDAVSLVEMDLKGTKLQVSHGSLEQNVVEFLNSGSYEKATEDELKEKWYDLRDVNFEMGSATALTQGSQKQLDNLVAILKAYPTAKIKIGGYTDKTGNEDSNKKISQARAEFIKAELEKAGVGAQVVSAEGYGSEFAKVAADASDEERATDRKMSIRFTK